LLGYITLIKLKKFLAGYLLESPHPKIQAKFQRGEIVPCIIEKSELTLVGFAAQEMKRGYSEFHLFTSYASFSTNGNI